MAVTHHKSSKTIRGITYAYGGAFKCYASNKGAQTSEGSGSASELEVGTTYYFMGYATGDSNNVTHPYAVSNSSGGAIRGWYNENVFPYKTYKVSFNANGGTGAPSDMTKKHGVTLTLPSTVPTRSGYTFVHWGSSATSTAYVNQPGGIYTGNEPYTYYAVWKKTLTLSYNANGGTGAPSSSSADIYNATTSKAFTISSTVPTRDGYTFLGWGTSASDTSADYSSGGSITISSNTTLYAVWRKILTLSYDANGGTGAPGKSTTNIYNATTSKAFTISSTVPTRTGYTFLGWATSSGATTATYSSGDTITLSSSTTLYAVWKINSYKLTINPNGGSWGGTTANSSATQNYNTTKTIGNPTWTGHTFIGWSLSGSGSLSGTTYTFGAGNGTLTAKWDTNEHTITYNAGANGGTIDGLENKSIEYEYGTKIGTLPTAYRKNYIFKGWFTSASGGTQITSTYTVTKNATFYAQFEIDASAYIKDESAWKAGLTYVEENGVVKKGHAMVNDNGVWKSGFCK